MSILLNVTPPQFLIPFMEKNLPNVLNYFNEFVEAIWVTIQMLVVNGFFAILIGLILGILLVVTKKGGLLENSLVYHILDKSTNIFRSIPFVILIPLLMPLTRAVFGTPIGFKGALLPLTIGCIPFFMRQVDLSLSDVDSGLIEAAQSMGLSSWEIITRVYLKESIPALVRSITITLVSLLGLTAMAGSIGGGGIGDFVIRYGHARFMYDITIVSVISIIIMVSIIEAVGKYFIKKTTH